MIAHNDICPYFKTFKITAVSKTVKNYIPVNFSGKNINPINNVNVKK